MKNTFKLISMVGIFSIMQPTNMKLAGNISHVSCGGMELPKALVFLSSKVILIIQIIIPLYIIIKGVYELNNFKKENKGRLTDNVRSNFITKLILSISLFTIISSTQILITIMSGMTNFTSYVQCITHGENKCNKEIKLPNGLDYNLSNKEEDKDITSDLRDQAYVDDGSNSPDGKPVEEGFPGIKYGFGRGWDAVFKAYSLSPSNSIEKDNNRSIKLYGLLHFSSSTTSLEEFINWLGNQTDKNSKKWYKKLNEEKIGSENFDNIWKSIDNKWFLKVQQKYAIETFYNPSINFIKKYYINFDPNNYTEALSSAILYSSITFGQQSNIFINVFNDEENLFNEEIILNSFKNETIKYLPFKKEEINKKFKSILGLYKENKDIKFNNEFEAGDL